MSTSIVPIDFESRSATDIKLGVERYSKDPECEALMLAFRMPDMAVPVVSHRGPHLSDDWCRRQELEQLLDHVASGGRIRAWNAMFECNIWANVCVPKYGWPPLKLEQCVDTMAQAAAMNLPQKLGECAKVLGLPADKQKDKRGKYLIQRLCKPHPPTKTRPGKWVEDEKLFAEFVPYNTQDVVAEEAVAAKLRPLSDFEQEVWLLTQRMNLRGVPVALDEAKNIRTLVEDEKERLNRELRRITGRRVLRATNRNGLLTWVNEQHGLAEPVTFDEEKDTDDLMPDMTGDTVESVLKRTDLTPEVRRALEIRAAVCQTSTAKYDRILKIAADDGTMKNLFVYHGAGTGRWASRGGFNVQNIARPTLMVNEKKGLDDIANAHVILGSGDHEAAILLWGDDVMDAAVSCIRGVLKAKPGHDFIDADYSSVENRVGVWLAGQQDKVDMFAKGLDEYKVFASTSLYNVPYDQVTKDMRQMSKSAVLGCFAADTEVLTCRGFVPIHQVRNNDRIWDGVDFVEHGGVVYQGKKAVIDLAGVRVTPEHLLLQENGWERADLVDLRSATCLAAGLLSATKDTEKRLRPAFGVNAASNGWCLSTTLNAERPERAGGAQTPTRTRFSETKPATQASFRIRLCESVGSIVGWVQSLVATTQIAATIQTTASAAYSFAMSGATTARLFCAGSWPSRAGTTPSLSWNVWTTTGPTRRITAGWQRARNSVQTRAELTGLYGQARLSPPAISGKSIAPRTGLPEPSLARFERAKVPSRSSPRSPVAEEHTYDIVNCGPRSRFAIRTDAGVVIAHNCLFGQGPQGLIDYAKGYGVTLTLARSEGVVNAYRSEYDKVRKLWYACGDASIKATQNPGEWFKAGEKLALKVHKNFLWMRLPSGRVIAWSSPRVEIQDAPWFEDFYNPETGATEKRKARRPVVTVESVDTYTRKFCRHKLIGSSIYQSAVQGTARDILAQGAMNVEAAGYPIVLMAHDELMAHVPEGFGSEEEFGRLMCKPADWYADLPLSYEAYRSRRFKK